MKQQVDKLIANILLDEGEIYLPEVGTLLLYRQAAKLLSAKQLQPSYRELRLTKEQRGVSITQYISQIAEVSKERANDIYAEWLEQSQRNDILTINDLCRIEKGSINTDKTFEDMANPKGRGTKRVNPRTNYLIYVVASLCMGFALGVAGYVLYSNGTFDSLIAKRMIAPASEALECTTTDAPQPAEQAVAVVEKPTENVTAPVEDVSAPAEPAILPMKSGCSYAVWGVYNELQNAENAVAWLSSHISEIEDVHIYDYDGRYMVALCEIASRSKCGHKVSAWKAEHISCKSVWVYTR